MSEYLGKEVPKLGFGLMRLPKQKDDPTEIDVEQVKQMVKLLGAEKAAYDCGAYKDAPPGLRFWCGATVETADIEKVFPWLEWAYAEVTKA